MGCTIHGKMRATKCVKVSNTYSAFIHTTRVYEPPLQCRNYLGEECSDTGEVTGFCANGFFVDSVRILFDCGHEIEVPLKMLAKAENDNDSD